MKKSILKLIFATVLMFIMLSTSAFAATDTVKVLGVTLTPGKYYEVLDSGEFIETALDAAPASGLYFHLSADGQTLTVRTMYMTTTKEEDFIWTDLDHLTIDVAVSSFINFSGEYLKGHSIVGNNITIIGNGWLLIHAENGIVLTGDLVINAKLTVRSMLTMANTNYTIDAENVHLKAFSSVGLDGDLALSPTTNLIIDPLPESYLYDVYDNLNSTQLLTDMSAYTGMGLPYGVLIISAQADVLSEGEVRIYRTLVTPSNATDILGDGTVSYDESSKTLYLRNVNLQDLSDDEYFIESRVDGLNIVLQGNNLVSHYKGSKGSLVALWNDTTIKGGGTIRLSCHDEAIISYKENSNPDEVVVNLTVENATLNAYSDSLDAISESNSNGAKLNLIVNDGAIVYAESYTNQAQVGIHVNGIEINGGSVTAKGVMGLAVTEGGFIMNGGKLTAITVPYIGGTNYPAIRIVSDTAQMNGGEIIAITDNNIAIRIDGQPMIMTGGSITAQAANNAFDNIGGSTYNNFAPDVALPSGYILSFKAGDSADNINTTDIASYTSSKYAKLEVGYPISVDGTLVTPQNQNDILPSGENAGKVKYNPTTKILTLQNASISRDIAGSGVVQILGDGITLNFIGTNSITNQNADTGNSDAISSAYPFTISGGGSLAATSGTVDSNAIRGTATITGGKQTLIGSGAAFSEKPTFNYPLGHNLQIMAGAATPGTAVAESEDYHLNQYVGIQITAPVYNPIISPDTGVYSN